MALSLAAGFLWAGAHALEVDMLPPRLGIFVAPPQWIVGLALLLFALFLFLIGVSELVHYLRPGTEVVIGPQGISTFGLLGERRVAWSDVTAFEIQDDLLSLKLRRTGRAPPRDMRIHFSRLDVEPVRLVAALRAARPDLLA